MHFFLITAVSRLCFLSLSFSSSANSLSVEAGIGIQILDSRKIESSELHCKKLPSSSDGTLHRDKRTSETQRKYRKSIGEINQREGKRAKKSIVTVTDGDDGNTDNDSMESLPQPNFEEGNELNPWPLTAFRDFSISFLSLYHLIQNEHKFYLFLKYYAEKWKNRLRVEVSLNVDRYIKTYEKEVFEAITKWNLATKGKRNYMAIINHPFLILALLRRCAFEFMPLYKSLQKSGEVSSEYLNFRILLYDSLLVAGLLDIPSDTWPSPEDFTKFASLIQMFHFVHDFDILQMTRGQFGGIVSNITVDPSDVTKIGQVAFQDGYYASAVDWMRTALHMITESQQNGSFNDTPSSSTIEMYWKSFIRMSDQHDAQWTKEHVPNFFFFQEKVDRTQNKSVRQLTNKFLSQEIYRGYRKYDPQINHVNFLTLCKTEENWQTKEEQRELNCWYDITIAIFPYKFELLNKDPPLLQIHDFVTREEANHLIQRSYEQPLSAVFESSFAYTSNDTLKSRTNVSERAGSVAWIDRTDKVLTKLEYKIEGATKLNVRGDTASESFHVASNIPGGHFTPHFDVVLRVTNNTRVATFLIYLNKVSLGGKTAFPVLGFSVKPKPRSALLWYNNKPDGSLDHRLHHGGCPVVLGQKWVGTKWIMKPTNQFCVK